MKLVCILFDYAYNDADVIAVPDSLYDNIQELGQQFQWWLGKGEHDFGQHSQMDNEHWLVKPMGLFGGSTNSWEMTARRR